ncbi:MAG: hypothetical protein KBC94_09345 [Pseudacidovorax sp.]|nr:hypothetical protein [Pseudacidovorax sp.]
MGSSSALAAAPAANSSISNQASASYLDTNGNAQVAASNVVVTTVQQVGSFTLDAKATTGGPLDIVNTKSGAAGAVIYAPHVLINTGNGADSFNISVAGSTKFNKVEIYSDTNSDGLPDSATPLCSGTTGCTVSTAQTVAGSNGKLSFVVAYSIPATATGSGAYDVGDVTVTPITASTSMYATSNQSVSVQDTVSLTTTAAFNVSNAIGQPGSGINPPSGAWPTAINNGKRSSSTSCATTWSSTLASSATGPSALPTVSNASVPAGSWTKFDLWLTNNDSAANSYALSASSTTGFPGTLPSGWTVKFAAGAVPADQCKDATAITSTASVAVGGNTEVTACVYVPVTQVKVTQAVYFQAKANSAASDGSTPVDIIYDQVIVTSAADTFGASLTPNGEGQVAPGGSVVYAHLVQATGTATCKAGGKVSVTLDPADVTAGWTYAVYIDTNGNGQLDAADTLVTSATTLPDVVPGTPQYLLVKVFAPGGAVAGATDIATVKVDFSATTTPGCGAPTATDTSKVVTGQVRLYASQAKNPNATCDKAGINTALNSLTANAISAKPGECIVYQLKAVNEGTSVLTNLNLTDVVPAYTTLTTVQPDTTCASTSIAPQFTSPTGWTSATTSVTCGNGTTATTVNPGGTATLTFQVQINNQ